MSVEPWLWLLAGPNGAGKSTLAKTVLSSIDEIVQPDEIAMVISPSIPAQAAIPAGRAAVRLRGEMLARRQSFAIETTLSGRTYLRVVRAAKTAGWKIGLIYIGLGSPDLAISRVRERVRAGGHDVPPTDVRRRYARSLGNVAAFARLADRAIFFDNSSDSRPVLRVLEVNSSQVVFKRRNQPAWLRRCLPAKQVAARKKRRRK